MLFFFRETFFFPSSCLRACCAVLIFTLHALVASAPKATSRRTWYIFKGCAVRFYFWFVNAPVELLPIPRVVCAALRAFGVAVHVPCSHTWFLNSTSAECGNFLLPPLIAVSIATGQHRWTNSSRSAWTRSSRSTRRCCKRRMSTTSTFSVK